MILVLFYDIFIEDFIPFFEEHICVLTYALSTIVTLDIQKYLHNETR